MISPEYEIDRFEIPLLAGIFVAFLAIIGTAAVLGQTTSPIDWKTQDLIAGFCEPAAISTKPGMGEFLKSARLSHLSDRFPSILQEESNLQLIKDGLERCYNRVQDSSLRESHWELLNRIKDLLGIFEQYRQLREQLLTTHQRIHGFPQLELHRDEWPGGPDFPSGICSPCEDDWRAFNNLQRAADEIRSELRGRPSDIEAAKAASRRIEDAIETVCRPALRILRIDWASYDSRFRYYSWTQTRSQIDQIVKELQTPAMRGVCR